MKKLFFWIILVIIFTSSCKKEVAGPVPVITTSIVDSIMYTTAFCGGNITSNGGSSITLRGVCWSIGNTPTISNSKTIDSASGGSFVCNITGLNPNTTYFVRAYATNGNGTGYGTTLSFTTKQSLVPKLTTDTVNNITQTSATSGGTITLLPENKYAVFSANRNVSKSENSDA